VLGFLCPTVVGLAYQFCPPSIGEFLGASERTATLSVLGTCAGLLSHTVSPVLGLNAPAVIGYLPADELRAALEAAAVGGTSLVEGQVT